jgi:hypothetical protein
VSPNEKGELEIEQGMAIIAPVSDGLKLRIESGLSTCTAVSVLLPKNETQYLALFHILDTGEDLKTQIGRIRLYLMREDFNWDKASVLVDYKPSVYGRESLSMAFLFLAGSALAAGEKVSYDYNQLFDYARKLLTRKEVRVFLKAVLTEELAGDEVVSGKAAEAAGKGAAKIRDISEPQVMILLQQNPEVFRDVERYLKEIPTTLKDTEKEAEARKRWRAYFKEMLRDPEHMKEFKRLNNPLEPMLLQTKDGKPGYGNLKIYFTHERVKDGKTLPACDRRKTHPPR